MQWLQDPKHSNVDNLNNVRREASGHFRNKRRNTFQEEKKEYLKAKIDEIETYSKINNIRDSYRSISDFKKGYQPRSNIVKSEKDDMVIDFHSILVTCRKHFSQLFNIHGVDDVRKT